MVASATGGVYPVAAMRLYIDNQSISTTYSASLDTYAPLADGDHYVVVVSWDTSGQSFTQSMHVTAASTPTPLVVSSSPSTTLNQPPAAPSAPTAAPDTSVISAGGVATSGPTASIANLNSGPYQANLNATSNWMATQSLPSGALMYSSQRINPYYSNLAAMGLIKDPARYVQVQLWMQWYVNHLNWPDRWGLYGTTYDYNITNGQEVSSGDADSTDSYAATFLSLAWAYYQTGDPSAQAYVRSIGYQLDVIGGVLVQTQQSDGLTWAKPDYQIKYLMDNCEAYRGLRDLASLFQALGDSSKQTYYNAAADASLQGIRGMWMNGSWAVYKDGIGRLMAPTMATWYPDATSQMFPVLYQVIPGSDPRSQQVYAAFNAAWPGWPTLSFNAQDPFPWVMIADASALMGDTRRVNTYINTVQQKYVSTGFPWTWYSMEGGWFMRLNAYMAGTRRAI